MATEGKKARAREDVDTLRRNQDGQGRKEIKSKSEWLRNAYQQGRVHERGEPSRRAPPRSS
jgi:hypothetical protein